MATLRTTWPAVGSPPSRSFDSNRKGGSQVELAGGPGRRIDIGGRKLYLHASGEGQGPAVILESGSLMPAVLWEPVQDRVARFARVVSYDRAGYGWSDPAGRNRSWRAVVDELHALLARAGIPGPYVLVAHSLGGMYARLFSARYPAEVAGMVLVDAWQEDLRQHLPPSHHRLDWWSRRLIVLLSALGIMRKAVRRNPGMLAGGDGAWLKHFPPERRAALFGAMYTPKLALAALREWTALDGAEEAARQTGPLGDLPLVVLSKSRPELDGWGYSEAAKASIWQAHQEAQLALVRLSSRGRQHPVPDTGHMIYLEKPDVVVAAVRAVFDQIDGQGSEPGRKSGERQRW